MRMTLNHFTADRHLDSISPSASARRNTVSDRVRRLLVCTLLATLTAVPAIAEVVLVSLEDGGNQVFQTNLSIPLNAPPEKLDHPHSSLVLPHFEVNKLLSEGETTLFSVRNSGTSAVNYDISYFDTLGNLTVADLGNYLRPSEVATRNLRHVPVPSDSSGVARGWVQIDGPPGSSLSGDFFQLDQDENFANGSRLIGASERCQFWDIRFFKGGGFDGGTLLHLFTDNPRGIDPADPPTLAIIVYDESSSIFGTVGVKMEDNSVALPVEDVLAALPGGIGPAFGSLWLGFGELAGGHIEAVYSALGRFSVGIKGNCLDGQP